MRTRNAIALSVLVGAALAAPAAPVSACGFAIAPAVDKTAGLVAAAERSLDAEDYAKAAETVLQRFPGLKTASPNEGPLEARSLRILAVAVVRLDGALAIGKEGKPASADDRRKNLEWAITALRALDAKRPKTPSLQTALAEALAKSSKTRGEALTMLRALADKDLLTSAHGYAALARLKAAAGDQGGRDAALLKCSKMTKSATVCTAPDAVKNA